MEATGLGQCQESMDDGFESPIPANNNIGKKEAKK
jgi:hypothetical protein